MKNVCYLAHPSTQMVRFSTTTGRIRTAIFCVTFGRRSMCLAETS